jgi:signal transduction histidine kinase
MRSLSRPESSPPRRARSIDLKTSLIGRIAVVAVACFALVATAVLFNMDREARRNAQATTDLVAKHLNLQLLRINAGFDASRRFPDWDALLPNYPTRGQCVRLENAHGAIVRSDCVGSLARQDDAPAWFSAIWSLLSSEQVAASPVAYKGDRYGTIIVTSDPKAVASRAWNEMKHLLLLTALTIAALSVLVYAAVARALAPTREVIAGLNRLSAGELSYRLPAFKLSELQRIADVTNELAQRIETTLSERAELSRRLINAQEDERCHLARELHDELGQNLTAIAALAASLEKSAEEACPEVRVEARSLSQITMRTMQSLRATLAHLRPAELDKLGLKQSLKHLIDICSASYGRTTRFELELPRELAPLSDTAAAHIFRIAQEGLTNAAKHADAKTVRLSVEPVPLVEPRSPDAAGICLTIEDDGRGRRRNGKAGANGMGLLNIEERVAALGGTMSLDDRPGAGFKVRVVVPLASAQAEEDKSPS